jgi:glycosyltransferase involved in cell wall biosynthesis
MKRQIISVIASTNYDSDARVMRSVRALTEAGFLVDPVLIAPLEPGVRVLEGSYGIQYTHICPRQTWVTRSVALAKRWLKYLWRLVSQERTRTWVAGLLVLFSVGLLAIAWALDSLSITILGVALLVSAWFIHSAIWVGPFRKAMGIAVSRLLQLESRGNQGAKELISHLLMIKPDLILMHDMVPLKYMASIRENVAAQVVWDAHEFYPDVAGLLPQRSAAFHKKLLQVQTELNGFIVVNPMIEEVYHERYPAMPPSVSVTNACRTSLLVSYDGRLHEAAGVPQSMRILLFQGGLSAHRGLERLARVAPLLPEEWVVVFMGKGNLLPTLKNLANSRARIPRDSPHTVFVSPAHHEELVMWTAGATLATIFYEPTCINQRLASPNKIWEYAGAGVPVLTNDLPFIRSKVELYDSGWLVPDGATANDLAEFIGGLSADDLESKARNARVLSLAEDGLLEEKKLVNYINSFLQDGSGDLGPTHTV